MIILTSDITGTDIVTTYKTLVFVMGAVLAVWGFIKVLKEINKPLTDLRKTVEDHSEKITEIALRHGICPHEFRSHCFRL